MYKQTHLPLTVATLSLFLRDLQVLSLLSFSSDQNASVDWQESNRKLILAPAMLINNNTKCFPSENESVLPSVDRYSPSPIHLAVWKCLLGLMSRTGVTQSHPGQWGWDGDEHRTAANIYPLYQGRYAHKAHSRGSYTVLPGERTCHSSITILLQFCDV